MRTSRRGAGRLALAAGLLALAAPAGAVAAVNEPPAAPHLLTLFPQRDFVSGEGFAPGSAVTYHVIRNGTVIGTSEAVTADASGLAEVNHPGGGCWLTTTPDILPGDKVRATVAGAPDQHQSTVADVTAERPANPSAGTIVIRGTARDAGGRPLPVGELEQRMVATSADPFDKSGRRTLRAPGDGTIAYDAAGSPNWTARYTGLTAHDVALAMSVESRGMWVPANGTETTIYETPGAPGPSSPCTAPLATNAVTASDHTYDGRNVVNAGNVGASLLLSGVAQADATQVRVTVRDAAGRASSTVTALLSTGPGGRTWSVAIPAAEVAALADGTLTASAVSTIPGGTIGGATLAITKDTARPGAPVATPPAGTYDAAPSVFLTSTDAGASILYTLDGSAPGTAPSPTTTRYAGALAVTRTLTVKGLALDPNGNPSAVAEHAYTLVPKVALDPAGTIDYGTQAVGTTSAGVPVTLRNTGAADLVIGAVGFTGTHAADFARGVSTCTAGTTLVPGQSCAVQNVRFTPAAAGPRSAALAFTTNAPGSPHAVPLTGDGAAAPAPAVAVAPAALAFGDQVAGTTSAARTVTVRNTGSADLAIGAVAAAGTGFAKGADTCAGAALAPGGSCTIGVTFAPAATGPASGTLTIAHDAGPASTVPLSGSGVAAPAEAPAVTLAPGSVTFAAQRVGTTSAARTVTLTNSGTAPLAVGTVSLGGANPTNYATSADTCANTMVAPAASCTVTVRFAPGTRGTKVASLVFASTASPGTHSVALSGAAVAPIASVSPTAIAFGSVRSGATSAPRRVTVTNSGTAGMTFTAFGLTGSHAGQFAISARTCSLTAQLAAPGTCTIDIVFRPTGVLIGSAARTAALTIAGDAPGSPHRVDLGGTARGVLL